MRVAAFDCGTNSLRLLVAEVRDEGGTPVLHDVHRTMEVVRLGQGVDRTGRISAAAMERAFEVARRYAALCEREGVQAVRFVATSASRDAANADEFITGIREIVGVAPEVVSGDEEARLSFTGAVAGLGAAADETVCVVDLGGGSTEIVLGSGEAVRAAVSLDVGSVRLTERHAFCDPPAAAELAAAQQDVDAALTEAERGLDLAGIDRLVGVAGTVTTLTAYALGLDSYDSTLIHGRELALAQHRAACDDLLRMTRAQRAALGFMHPGRADVIGAGALIWSSLLTRVAAASGVDRVLTSEHDILDGIARGLVER